MRAGTPSCTAFHLNPKSFVATVESDLPDNDVQPVTAIHIPLDIQGPATVIDVLITTGEPVASGEAVLVLQDASGRHQKVAASNGGFVHLMDGIAKGAQVPPGAQIGQITERPPGAGQQSPGSGSATGAATRFKVPAAVWAYLAGTIVTLSILSDVSRLDIGEAATVAGALGLIAYGTHLTMTFLLPLLLGLAFPDLGDRIARARMTHVAMIIAATAGIGVAALVSEAVSPRPQGRLAQALAPTLSGGVPASSTSIQDPVVRPSVQPAEGRSIPSSTSGAAIGRDGADAVTYYFVQIWRDTHRSNFPDHRVGQSCDVVSQNIVGSPGVSCSVVDVIPMLHVETSCHDYDEPGRISGITRIFHDRARGYIFQLDGDRPGEITDLRRFANGARYGNRVSSGNPRELFAQHLEDAQQNGRNTLFRGPYEGQSYPNIFDNIVDLRLELAQVGCDLDDYNDGVSGALD